MTRWKKLLLILVALLVLSQLPFLYRRYKLGRLHATIQELNAQRAVAENNSIYAEFKGVLHVHSSLGGHSNGTFEEIVAAAQSNQLDFVVMTEHPSATFDTAQMTLKGKHGGVLFVNGNEVKTADGDRLLLIPGDSGAGIDSRLSTQEVLTRRSGGLAIVAYPEEFRSWGVTGYKGVEVYNIYTNARRINPLVMFFDGLWSYGSYPELLFATFYNRPAGNLQGWDQQIRQSGMRLVATAGNDAHANIGISINDSSGKTLLGFRLDPYERSFRLVRLHVLTNPFHAQTLDEGSLLSALAEGHCYIGFDVLGDSTGFRFEAQSAGTSRIMGDEIRLVDEVKLSVSTPVNSRIVLLRDGGVIQEANGANRLELKARERGSYRVEVYLPQLGKPAGEQPWIISNPIYVR